MTSIQLDPRLTGAQILRPGMGAWTGNPAPIPAPAVPTQVRPTTPTLAIPKPAMTPTPQVAQEGPGMIPPKPAPMTPTAPATGAPSGFQDIRSQLVTAPLNPVGQQAQGQLGTALQGLQGASTLPAFHSIGATDPSGTLSALQAAMAKSQSPMADQLRQMGMSSLQGLSSAPDRGQLAAQALSLQRQLTQPQWEQDLRHVGQSAAALGRLGSGMTTSELGDVTLQREKALGLYGQQAALDAAGQTMADRLNRFNATAGYGGQIAGQDLARAGFGQQNALAGYDVQNTSRGQAVGERDAGQQAALNRAALQQNLVNTTAGVQGQMFGQGMQTAGLQTQQQQWQNQLEQQAQQDRVQQQMLQEQLLNGQFNRQQGAAETMGRFGYGNDPYSLMLQGSQYQQGQASDQQDQLAQMLQQQAMQRALATYGQGANLPPSPNPDPWLVPPPARPFTLR